MAIRSITPPSSPSYQSPEILPLGDNEDYERAVDEKLFPTQPAPQDCPICMEPMGARQVSTHPDPMHPYNNIHPVHLDCLSKYFAVLKEANPEVVLRCSICRISIKPPPLPPPPPPPSLAGKEIAQIFFSSAFLTFLIQGTAFLGASLMDHDAGIFTAGQCLLVSLYGLEFTPTISVKKTIGVALSVIGSTELIYFLIGLASSSTVDPLSAALIVIGCALSYPLGERIRRGSGDWLPLTPSNQLMFALQILLGVSSGIGAITGGEAVATNIVASSQRKWVQLGIRLGAGTLSSLFGTAHTTLKANRRAVLSGLAAGGVFGLSLLISAPANLPKLAISVGLTVLPIFSGLVGLALKFKARRALQHV